MHSFIKNFQVGGGGGGSMIYIDDISGKVGRRRGRKKKRCTKGESKKVGNDVRVRAAASVIN